jgi:hypothetical protein
MGLIATFSAYWRDMEEEAMKWVVLSLAAALAIQTFGSANAQPRTTCSQTFARCTAGCDSGAIRKHGTCRGRCQQRQDGCMATGIWETWNGQQLPRQRQ